MDSYYTRLVVSGSVAELYIYENQIYPSKRLKGRLRGVSMPIDNSALLVAQNRAKRNLRRLVACNSWRWYSPKGKVFNPMFLTLTFKENVQDFKIANSAFTRFIQRLNYSIFRPLGLVSAYIAITEIQKRGSIHYHCIFFNLPFIKKNVYSTLLGIWRKNNSQGSIYLERVNGLDGAVRYMAKYLTKNFGNSDFKNHKRYFASRNLLKPIECKNDIVNFEFFEAFDIPFESFNWLGSFPQVGDIRYKKYTIDNYLYF